MWANRKTEKTIFFLEFNEEELRRRNAPVTSTENEIKDQKNTSLAS